MTDSSAGEATVIRPETADDHEAIARVVHDAFFEVGEGPAVRDLVGAIRASDGYRPASTLVAEADGEVVGFVMVSTANRTAGTAGDESAPRETIALLSPLAVEPGRQRAGIGTALLHAVFDAVAAGGDSCLVLEGDPRYYSRVGFEPSERHGLTLPLPDWAPPEAGQIRWLVDESDRPDVAGRVIYPPPFDGLD